MDRLERRRQAELRSVYEHGWGVLTAWALCKCGPGACPLETELTRLGVDPGDLLVALALGQPSAIGIR